MPPARGPARRRAGALVGTGLSRADESSGRLWVWAGGIRVGRLLVRIRVDPPVDPSASVRPSVSILERH